MLDRKIKKSKLFLIPSIFAIFQFTMPFAGWTSVHYAKEHFENFRYVISWIALMLLVFLGVRSILSCKKDNCNINDDNSNNEKNELTYKILIVQGIATSIDALSVGFTISELNVTQALISSAIIGAITYIDCLLAIIVGKK